MSWSFSIPPTPQSALDEALNTAAEEYIPLLGGESLAETMDQITATAMAALALAESGAFGDGPLRISLSGHANPSHTSRPGWSDDYVTITLSSTPKPPTA